MHFLKGFFLRLPSIEAKFSIQGNLIGSTVSNPNLFLLLIEIFNYNCVVPTHFVTAHFLLKVDMLTLIHTLCPLDGKLCMIEQNQLA